MCGWHSHFRHSDKRHSQHCLEDIFHKVVQERLSLGGYVEWNDHDVASISWDLGNGFGRLCLRLRRRRRTCGDSVGVEPEALEWVPKAARVQMVQGYVRASGVHALDGEFFREKRLEVLIDVVGWGDEKGGANGAGWAGIVGVFASRRGPGGEGF